MLSFFLWQQQQVMVVQFQQRIVSLCVLLNIFHKHPFKSGVTSWFTFEQCPGCTEGQERFSLSRLFQLPEVQNFEDLVIWLFVHGNDGFIRIFHVAFSFCGTLVWEQRNVTGPTLPESWWAVEFCTAPRREEGVAHNDEILITRLVGVGNNKWLTDPHFGTSFEDHRPSIHMFLPNTQRDPVLVFWASVPFVATGDGHTTCDSSVYLERCGRHELHVFFVVTCHERCDPSWFFRCLRVSWRLKGNFLAVWLLVSCPWRGLLLWDYTTLGPQACQDVVSARTGHPVGQKFGGTDLAHLQKAKVVPVRFTLAILRHSGLSHSNMFWGNRTCWVSGILPLAQGIVAGGLPLSSDKTEIGNAVWVDRERGRISPSLDKVGDVLGVDWHILDPKLVTTTTALIGFRRDCSSTENEIWRRVGSNSFWARTNGTVSGWNPPDPVVAAIDIHGFVASGVFDVFVFRRFGYRRWCLSFYVCLADWNLWKHNVLVVVITCFEEWSGFFRWKISDFDQRVAKQDVSHLQGFDVGRIGRLQWNLYKTCFPHVWGVTKIVRTIKTNVSSFVSLAQSDQEHDPQHIQTCTFLMGLQWLQISSWPGEGQLVKVKNAKFPLGSSDREYWNSWSLSVAAETHPQRVNEQTCVRSFSPPRSSTNHWEVSSWKRSRPAGVLFLVSMPLTVQERTSTWLSGNGIGTLEHGPKERPLMRWSMLGFVGWNLRDTWSEYDNPGPTSCFRHSVRHDDANPREDIDDSKTVLIRATRHRGSTVRLTLNEVRQSKSLITLLRMNGCNYKRGHQRERTHRFFLQHCDDDLRTTNSSCAFACW